METEKHQTDRASLVSLPDFGSPKYVNTSTTTSPSYMKQTYPLFYYHQTKTEFPLTPNSITNNQNAPFNDNDELGLTTINHLKATSNHKIDVAAAFRGFIPSTKQKEIMKTQCLQEHILKSQEIVSPLKELPFNRYYHEKPVPLGNHLTHDRYPLDEIIKRKAYYNESDNEITSYSCENSDPDIANNQHHDIKNYKFRNTRNGYQQQQQQNNPLLSYARQQSISDRKGYVVKRYSRYNEREEEEEEEEEGEEERIIRKPIVKRKISRQEYTRPEDRISYLNNHHNSEEGSICVPFLQYNKKKYTSPPTAVPNKENRSNYTYRSVMSSQDIFNDKSNTRNNHHERSGDAESDLRRGRRYERKNVSNSKFTGSQQRSSSLAPVFNPKNKPPRPVSKSSWAAAVNNNNYLPQQRKRSLSTTLPPSHTNYERIPITKPYNMPSGLQQMREPYTTTTGYRPYSSNDPTNSTRMCYPRPPLPFPTKKPLPSFVHNHPMTTAIHRPFPQITQPSLLNINSSGLPQSYAISSFTSQSMLTCCAEFRSLFPNVYVGLCKGLVDVNRLLAYEIVVPVKEEIILQQHAIRSKRALTATVAGKFWKPLFGKFPDPGTAPKLVKLIAEYFYERFEEGIKQAEDERSFFQWLLRQDIENVMNIRLTTSFSSGDNYTIINVEGSGNIKRHKGNLLSLLKPDTVTMDVDVVIKAIFINGGQLAEVNEDPMFIDRVQAGENRFAISFIT